MQQLTGIIFWDVIPCSQVEVLPTTTLYGVTEESLSSEP
jgi:hypothetical protein